MTPAEFNTKFNSLLREAFTTGETPVAQMIYDMELGKAQCVDYALSRMAAAQQSKILPANGKLPPNFRG